jgi:hypothetical protein
METGTRSDGLRLTACRDHFRRAVRRNSFPRNVDECGVRPGIEIYPLSPSQ